MKNWTVSEAVKVIREGKDVNAIKEIVKHFPLFAVIVASKDFDGLAAAMPEHVTVRKIENELNSGNAGDEDIDDEDTDGTDDDQDVSDEDLSAMSTKQLIALCEKRGIKVPKYGKNKQFYLDALSGGTEDDDQPDDDNEDEDDPVALYKQCKKAGLKVAPKKSAKYYKDALKKAKKDAEEAEDEDEDWDDDDQEEEKSKKSNKSSKSSKPTNKGKSKAKPEPEEDEDEEDEDDEDWDI